MFWYLFNTCLHVLWPYEFRDCYSRSIATGRYSISLSFQSRLFDINAWAMSDDIFKKWPEFYSDVPTYNRLPMTVSTTAARPSLLSPELSGNRSASTTAGALVAPPAQPGSIAMESTVIDKDTAVDKDTTANTLPTAVLFSDPLETPELANGEPSSSASCFYSVQDFDNWPGSSLTLPHEHVAMAAAAAAAVQSQALGAPDLWLDNISAMYGLSV